MSRCRPLAAAGSQSASTSDKKRDQVVDFILFQNIFKRRHPATAFEDLVLDLTRAPAQADIAQVGCPVAAYTCNAVATVAILGAKQIGSAVSRRGVRRMDDRATCHHEN